MDQDHYERVRELFLAVEELPPGEQEAYLQKKAAGDVELYAEVASLLAEHDPTAAQVEGECVQPVTTPQPITPAGITQPNGPSDVSAESANLKPSANPTDSTVSNAGGGQSVIPTQTKFFGSTDTRQPDADESKTNPDKSKQSRRGKDRSLITQQDALRTHASPRYKDTPKPRRSNSSLPIWSERARKSRRRNSGWLWLAALLPTAIVGWWTYDRVDKAMQNSVELRLQSNADNIALRARRFLDGQVLMAELWASQPAVREAVGELVRFSESDPDAEEMRQRPEIDVIHRRLQEYSANDEIRFVVWNSSYQIIASWIDGHTDVGNPVHPSGASNLVRVMAGESVLFGPERMVDASEGFVPETEDPVMAFIVPVRNDDGRIIASMLVRSDSSYEELNRIFTEFSVSSGMDAYAVNSQGVMVTASPHATSLATQNRFDLNASRIAAELRVSDPGVLIDANNRDSIRRAICPMTISVAGAVTEGTDVETDEYSNYAGEDVVGAWTWIDDWPMGIIVEEGAAKAFAPARLVRFGFLVLGSLLSVTAFLAAARIARVSTDEHAAVHPLSRYEIMGELGSGGMGVVFRGRHRQLGRDVALKVLRGDRHHREDRLRFEREAKLAASLKNPHSVMIYDYGHGDDGASFCVMQFLEGLTLQEIIARSGHQSIGRTLAILRQICDALSEAHGLGLMHRDVKPQNIMLSLDPTVGDWAIVFDYGLAKPLDPESSVYQTSETIWAGTPMYMAPERFREPSLNDPRSDLYSVGCIGYFLLTGQPPFIESDPESLFALILSEDPIGIGIHRGEEVDKEVSDLIFRCMSKQMETRFASISDLAREIDLLRTKYAWTTDQARVWWSQHGGH